MFDLANRILREAEKITDYAEVRVEQLDLNNIILKNGNLEGVTFSTTRGLAVRVLVNGGMGIAFTNNFEEPPKKVLETAIKAAKLSSKMLRKPIKMSEEEFFKEKYQVDQKINIQDVSNEEKTLELLKIEKALLETKVNLPIRFFELIDETKEKFYVNSNGAEIYSKIPRIGLEYLITAIKNGSSQQRIFQYGETGGWELFNKWNLIEKIVSEAKILSKLFSASKSPKGKMDVVISPEIVGIAAHESCGHPYEADRILGREAAQAGESFVTPIMLGEKIGTEVVNLVDDPTFPNSYGFYLYDDEGVKAKRRFLIKNGIINSFLQNRETAAELNTKSNAAARALSWSTEPIIRMANTFILPGNHSFEELIEGVKNGIYIKKYMEWNIDDRRFNQRYVGSEAYLIKNGKLGELVKRPVIEITTPSFYNSIDAVGKDLEFSAGFCGKGEPMQGIPVWFGGPHIRLKNIIMG